MAAATKGPERLRQESARGHLLRLADEVHALQMRAPSAETDETLAYLRRCFAGLGARDRELSRIAEQIFVWHSVANPARARDLTRSALAQHAALLLRRRGGDGSPRHAPAAKR